MSRVHSVAKITHFPISILHHMHNPQKILAQGEMLDGMGYRNLLIGLASMRPLPGRPIHVPAGESVLDDLVAIATTSASRLRV